MQLGAPSWEKPGMWADCLTPETLQHLLIFCVILTVVFPDVASSLFSNLLWVENWRASLNKVLCITLWLQCKPASQADTIKTLPQPLYKAFKEDPPSMSVWTQQMFYLIAKTC